MAMAKCGRDTSDEETALAPKVEVLGGQPGLGRDEILRRLRQYFASTDVERVVMFGSWANDTGDEYSDVDLVVVERTSAPFAERGLAHLGLFRLGFAVDLLVYTPEEYDQLLRDGNPLLERAERDGILVYVRPRA